MDWQQVVSSQEKESGEQVDKSCHDIEDEPEIEVVYGFETDESQVNLEPEGCAQMSDDQAFKAVRGIRLVTLENILEGVNSFAHLSKCMGPHYYWKNERIIGLRSELVLGCSGCDAINTIMSTREDINELMTLTTISTGLHHTGLSKLLTPLGCPVMTSKTFDRLQHTVGLKLMKLAVASCRYWCEQEKRYSFESGMPVIGGYQTVAGEGDACYAKRSKGTNYTSLSGGAVVLGHISKKVIDFDVCQVHCQTCKRAKNKGKEPPDHRCPINFEGKAQNMEPEMMTKIFSRSLQFNGAIISKFIADGDSSVMPTLRRHKIYIDLDVHIQKILCKLHLQRNFIKHLREKLIHGRLGNTSFRDQLLHSLIYLESKLMATIGRVHADGGTEDELKAQLECLVRHHFGRHDLCSAVATCQEPSNRQIVTDEFFEGIMSIANTSLLCHTSSLIENCDTNQVESFNNKLPQVTDGKRVNYSQSWSWIYRKAFSVLAWNSSDQDAVAMYMELVKGEAISEFHERFNLTRSKKRFKTSLYERPDHAKGILEYINADSVDPISYDPEYKHPYAMSELTVQSLTEQRGPGYSSMGFADREDLPEVELYKERDRILQFLLRVHSNRMDIACRTVTRHESEEFADIRCRVVPSDKIFLLCKYVEGRKDIRVASWPNKLYNVLGTGSIRYSDRFILDQKMRLQGLKWLAEHLEVNITQIGTLLHKQHPYLEGSPVGLIGDEHTVDVYYLYEHRTKAVMEAGKVTKWLSWIEATQSFTMRPSSEQYAKIQGDLAAAGRDSCIIVLLTDVDQMSFQLGFDEFFWDQRLPILTDFFYYGLYEQADPMKYRSQPPRPYSSIANVCESERWRTWP